MAAWIQEEAAKLIGANGTRRKDDYYPTPPECTEALMDFLRIPDNALIWEPASGGGHITDVLRSRYYTVIGTDLRTGTDFLTANPPIGVDWIITNPPFSLSEQFIRRAAELKIPFAFLLKSQYWHAARRVALFRECPPTWLLPLAWRPDFTGQGKSLMDVMWCVWTGNHEHGEAKYRPLEKPGGREMKQCSIF